MRKLHLALFMVLFAAAAHASYPGLEEKVVAAVKKAKPSVVFIETIRPHSQIPAYGSGVIIRPDGFILTNNHVVRNAQAINVYLYDKRHYSANIIKTSPAHDEAVIKIDVNNLTPIHWADSHGLELGQACIAIGSPMKFRFSVSTGCISGLDRSTSTRDMRFGNLIQTDAAINPGSSGGPLLNSNGDMIGLTTLVYTGDPNYPDVHPYGIAFAMPSDAVKQVADDLISGKNAGAVGKPWLGIHGRNLSLTEAETYGYPVASGVYVEGVTLDGPADRAGIKKKDVISKVNGKVIRTIHELASLIDGMKPDDTVELGVYSGVDKKYYARKVKLAASAGQ
ncbi:MAG: S1C family serine protease [Candidatus Xenobia bacterium]